VELNVKIKQKHIESIPEEQLEAEAQILVRRFVARRLASFFGSGALELGCANTYITENISVPPINISATMPNRTVIMLELQDEDSKLLQWAEFHNGVRSALRINSKSINKSSDNVKT